MDITSGIITVYNFQIKNIEFYLAYFLIFISIFFFFFLKKLNCKKIKKFNLNIIKIYSLFTKIINFKNENFILLILCSLYIYVGTNFITQLQYKNILPILVFICFVIFKYLQLFFNHKIFKKNNYKIIFFLLTPLLLYKVITSETTIIFLLSIGIIYFLTYYFHKNLYFLCLTILIFLLSNLTGGNFVLGDAFHSSEYFITTSNFIKNKDLIFPNIGLIEEIPFMISLVIQKFSKFLGIEIILSIASVQSLIAIILKNYILCKTYKKNSFFWFFLILLIPTYRISYLFLITFFLIFFELSNTKLYKEKYFFILSSAIPFLFLILPASSYVILFIIFTYLYFTKKYSLYYYSGLFLIFSIITIIFYKLFYFQISSILELRHNFFEANAIPFNYTSNYFFGLNFVIIFKYLFIIIIAIFIFDILNNFNKKIFLNFINILIYLFIIKIFLDYSLTRVDWNAAGRIVLLGLVVIFITNYINERLIIYSFPILILTVIAYPINISGFEKKTFKNLNFKLYDEAIISFEKNNLDIIEIINNLTKDKKILNLSDKPGLAFQQTKLLTPSPTSLWLYYSRETQIKLINILKKERFLIYLGTNDGYKVRDDHFYTFDGIDIRSRSPYLFKYLSDNYKIKIIDQSIFLIPEKNYKESSILFSNFDIGKAAHYYSGIGIIKDENIKINLICSNFTDINGEGKYKIVNEYNFFYAYLKCGENFINKIYFKGKNIEVIKTDVQTKPIVKPEYAIFSEW